MNRSLGVLAALAVGLAVPEAARSAEASAPADRTLDDVERGLAERTDPRDVLTLVLARNPDLGEAAERTRAAGEEASASGRLPDLEVRYQLWNAPIARPYDPEMHMLGVSQTFPAPGSRGARKRAGLEQQRMLAQTERARAQELAAQARRAFADYFRSERELAVRKEFVQLSKRLVELARASYQAGRVSQQDVLRAGVEQSRLQAEIAAAEQSRDSAKAMLNALMARPPGAPLGPPAAIELPAEVPPAEVLQAELPKKRPEIAAGESSVARAEASLQAERRESRWPTFMVGADYMFSPSPMEEGDRHGIGAMVSVNLPWLSGRHGDEVRQAERQLAAEKRARESAENAARQQLQDAWLRHRAARQVLSILDKDLLPQARQSFEAAESAFVSGQGDALGLLDAERSYLQVRLDRERALAQVYAALADLDRAAGLAAAPQPENDLEN